jgi:putative restriction endonuclease
MVLSGGYPDDEFGADSILYTGSGKRDPHTDAIVQNQELVRTNKALAKSCDDGLPIRVVQGLGVRRKQLPKQGYRYEGIYFIENYSRVTGVDGYKVWQFRLIKQSAGESTVYDSTTNKRVTTSIQRIVRNTALANSVKSMYEHRCQICRLSIRTPSGGYYSEGAHIRPLGSNHNGSDSVSNLLCLCPNHHTMLDYGSIYIDNNYQVYERAGNNSVGILYVFKNHYIDKDNLEYQRKIFD